MMVSVRYEEAIQLCDHGLLKMPSLEAARVTELKESRAKAEKSLKERERNARREALALKKRQRENQQLLDLVRSRGVQVLTHKVDEDDNLKEAWDLDDLEPTHPAALNKRVHLIQEDSDTLLGEGGLRSTSCSLGDDDQNFT